MKITLKLDGKQREYLPKNSSKNESSIETKDGIHIILEDRAKKLLSDSDCLAVWPQSTG